MTDSKTANRRTGSARDSNVWTDEERAAMKEAAAERKQNVRRGPRDERAEGEAEVRAKIAAMPDHDRAMAERVHALVTEAVPSLVPRTYYGMPAYAKDGKTVCFFKPASKFKERYATLGFESVARLDDGSMWATSYALMELTPADEKKIAALVRKAVG